MMKRGLVIVPDESDHPIDVRGTTRRFLGYLASYRLQIVLTILGSIGLSLLTLLPAILTRYIVNDFIPQSNLVRIIQVGVVMVVGYGIRTYLVINNQYLITWVGQQLVYELGKELFEHVQRLPMSFHERVETGQIMSRITNDVGSLQQALLGGAVTSVVSIINLIVYLVVLLALNWQMTVLILVTVPGLVATSVIISSLLRVRFREVQAQVADVTAALEEGVAGVRVTKAFAREDYSIAQFAVTTHDNFNASMRAGEVQAVYGPIVQLIG
ncbi:MAG: ABC transporter transmembrane domain-containing protein, partial [Chloroflexi bacterium]|nr:ABC transporter transmembrane domain-containing protein [Chloroflexota bacterium]